MNARDSMIEMRESDNGPLEESFKIDSIIERDSMRERIEADENLINSLKDYYYKVLKL